MLAKYVFQGMDMAWATSSMSFVCVCVALVACPVLFFVSGERVEPICGNYEWRREGTMGFEWQGDDGGPYCVISWRNARFEPDCAEYCYQKCSNKAE
jgi:hypothetical protein